LFISYVCMMNPRPLAVSLGKGGYPAGVHWLLEKVQLAVRIVSSFTPPKRARRPMVNVSLRSSSNHVAIMELLLRLDHLEGILNYCRTKVRSYRDLNYLLLTAQRLAATKAQFIVLQKAA